MLTVLFNRELACVDLVNGCGNGLLIENYTVLLGSGGDGACASCNEINELVAVASLAYELGNGG